MTVSNEERTWGMMAHIGPILVSLVSSMGWVVALILYLVYKDKSKFVAFHALQSLYFHLFLFVVAMIGVVTICIGIGVVILALLGVTGLIFAIIAGINANNGELYEYPVVGQMARRAVGI